MLSRKSIAAVAVVLCAMLNRAHAQFQPGEFVTYSSQSWGATPSAGNAAELLLHNFDLVYPNGVVEVGISGPAGFSIVFSSAAAVLNYEPASGGPAPLTSDLLDPVTTSSGFFGGHVLALKLTMDFADTGLLGGSVGVPFADLVLHGLADPQYPSDLNGSAVREFFTEVNLLLGGGSGPRTIDENALLLDDVMRAFEGGQPSQFAQDHLRIVPEPATGMLALMALVGLVASTTRIHGKRLRIRQHMLKA